MIEGRGIAMNEEQLRQKALEEYWENYVLNNPGRLIPAKENGMLAEPDFSNLLKDLAKKEIFDAGYMLGVNPDGTLDEDSIRRIEETIESIVNDIYKTNEERIESRRQRTIQHNNEEEYNYMLTLIAINYENYSRVCEKYGVEPNPIYESPSKEKSL